MSYEIDIYAKYAAGELTEEERLKLEQSGELAELDKILKASDELKLPSYDLDKAYAKLNQQNNQVVKPSKIRSLVLPLSIAASLLLITGAFLFFTNQATTIMADHNGSKTHQFSDGSEIIINNGSSISYHKKSWTEERTVQLTGEAYFKVEKGKQFTVKTNFGEIQVLGTSFNVRTHDDLLEVQCFSGKVKVANQKGTHKMLKAKEEVKLIKQKFESVQPIDESQPLWQKGVSKFDETKAKLVFHELERQYNLGIGGNIPDKNFTGRFVHGDLEKAISQICKPLNLECQINKEKNQIEIK